MLEHRITYVVCGAGNQTLVGEVPASFVDSDFDMITEGTG